MSEQGRAGRRAPERAGREAAGADHEARSRPGAGIAAGAAAEAGREAAPGIATDVAREFAPGVEAMRAAVPSGSWAAGREAFAGADQVPLAGGDGGVRGADAAAQGGDGAAPGRDAAAPVGSEVPAPAVAEEVAALRARAAALERELAESTAAAQRQLARAELKAEALRAGMIDLDGLKLLDLEAVRLDERGEVVNGAALMRALRQDKPWLFGAASSSSTASAPPSIPPRPKLATEMSVEEWRVARSDLLRRR